MHTELNMRKSCVQEGVKKVANNTPGSPMDISPANQSPTTKHKKSRFGPDEISSKVILPRGCAKVQESASDQDGDSGTSTGKTRAVPYFKGQLNSRHGLQFSLYLIS